MWPSSQQVAGLLFALIVLAVLAVRLSRCPRPSELMLILGSGGHTTQLLLMLRDFDFSKVSMVRVLLANTDSLSADRFMQLAKDKGLAPERYSLTRIPRSREVKQNAVSSLFTTLWSLCFTALLSFRLRQIKIIFSNGPGTAIPVLLVYWLRRVLGGTPTKIVFVESWCRCRTFSLSARIAKVFADKTVVLWQRLGKADPRTTVKRFFD